VALSVLGIGTAGCRLYWLRRALVLSAFDPSRGGHLVPTRPGRMATSTVEAAPSGLNCRVLSCGDKKHRKVVAQIGGSVAGTDLVGSELAGTIATAFGGQVAFKSVSGLSLVLSEVSPITPGHVVVLPSRLSAERLADLSCEELVDLWQTVRDAEVQARAGGGDCLLDPAEAVSIAVKDGSAAGSPIPHLHVHVVPRRRHDFEENDKVHVAIDDWAPPTRMSAAEAQRARAQQTSLEVPPDNLRRDRTLEDMAAEAQEYRAAASRFGVLQAKLPLSLLFAEIRISGDTLFYASSTGLTVAFVNLRPIVPGHVLVTPVRSVPLLADLTDAELDDLFLAVRVVQELLEKCHGAKASNLGIQDGVLAGQSVPHVHVHVLPRMCKMVVQQKLNYRTWSLL